MKIKRLQLLFFGFFPNVTKMTQFYSVEFDFNNLKASEEELNGKLEGRATAACDGLLPT